VQQDQSKSPLLAPRGMKRRSRREEAHSSGRKIAVGRSLVTSATAGEIACLS
jgi:hypothetical protein